MCTGTTGAPSRGNFWTVSRPGAGSASRRASATRAGRRASPRRGTSAGDDARGRRGQATSDVAEPRAARRAHRRRTSPARSPRRGCSTVGPVAEQPHARWRRRRRRRRRGSRGAGTAPRRRAAATPSRSSACSSTSMPALGGESTMPWSATTSSRTSRGSASRSCSASASTIDQLLQPLRRGHAVAVPGPVEVAVVEVGQRLGRSADAATAAAIRSPTRSAPTKSAPRCAATVSPLSRNSRLLTTVTAAPSTPQPRERGGVRLPLLRVDVLVPRPAR